jgi:hypothetical protein
MKSPIFTEIPQFLYLAISFIPAKCKSLLCHAFTDLYIYEVYDLANLKFEINSNLKLYKSNDTLDEALVSLFKKRKMITIKLYHIRFSYSFNIKNKSLHDALFMNVPMSLQNALLVQEIPAQASPLHPFRLEILSESSTSDSPKRVIF